MLVTVASGMAFRFAPLGLPPILVKYGGSTMWAAMIYWIVSALRPRWRIRSAVLLAGAIATALEFVKLGHWPPLEAFRLTLPGILLLGRIFSFTDILVYWLAILAAGSLDGAMRKTPAF